MIYVDKYPEWLKVPKKWENGGHLFSSNLDELHQFAQKLGLKREWYQGGKGHFPHYDLTWRKRLQALRMGAVSCEPGIIPNDVVRHDPN